MPGIFWLVPVVALVTVIFIIYLARYVLAKDTGTPKMKEIGDMIFQGAWAFLNRQYRTIAMYRGDRRHYHRRPGRRAWRR